MKDAVRQIPDGVILDLEISPGSKKTEVHGYNPWRKRIEVRLSERAHRGRANEQLIFFLSDLFKISSKNITIIAGLTGSKKSIKLTGIRQEGILKVLTENEQQDS